jgi:hypothetical protein
MCCWTLLLSSAARTGATDPRPAMSARLPSTEKSREYRVRKRLLNAAGP